MSVDTVLASTSLKAGSSVYFFGVDEFPFLYLQTLERMAVDADIFLYSLSPTFYFWEDFVSDEWLIFKAIMIDRTCSQ